MGKPPTIPNAPTLSLPAVTATKPVDTTPKYKGEVDMGKATLVITERIQKQIDFLHRNVGPTEWSGILLYTIEGNLRDVPNLVFTAQELFLMDIGSGTYTEYDGSPDIVDMWDNIENMENYRMGHIHSHHNMTTFFSGTDTGELKDNAHNHVIYLSLIVNFAKIYSAKAVISAKQTKESALRTRFVDIDDTSLVIDDTDAEELPVLCIIELDIKMPVMVLEEEDFFSRRYDEVKRRPKVSSYTSGYRYSPPQTPAAGGEHLPSKPANQGLEGGRGGILLKTLLPDLRENQKERAARLVGIKVPISVEATKSQILMLISLLLTAELASPNTQIAFAVKRLKTCHKSYADDTFALYMASIIRSWTESYLKNSIRRTLQMGVIEAAVSYLDKQVQSDIVNTLVDSLVYGVIEYFASMDYLPDEYKSDFITELLDRFNIEF